MAQHFKIIFLLFFTSVLFCTAKNVPSFVRERKVSKKLSPTKIKELIGYELKDLLTLSSDLIASLASSQQIMIAKMHSLVSQESGDFFAEANSKKLDSYLSQLQHLHQDLKRTKINIEQQFSYFSKNFTT